MLRHFDLAFQEQVVRLDQPDTRQNILKFSPAARVPVLLAGDQAIWESLAIIEFIAEQHPDLAVWPRDPIQRAQALVMAAEMHSGLTVLREELPFELQMHAPHGKPRRAVEDDIDRICDIWRQGQGQFGARGKFLFGDFSAVDVMCAPVAVRFKHYGIALDDVCQGYVEAVFALPPLQEWLAAAALETPTSG